MATILVTGATGNVGAEVIRLLRAADAAVRAAVLDPTVDHIDGVPCARFDFTDATTHAPALQDVSKVFLVRPPAIANTRRDIDPFIAAARDAGVRHIVFLSLLGAERNKVVPHRAIEESLRRSGVSWTFLRPSFFMQNLVTTHRDDIREWDEILVPAGNGRTSFIDVRDIAAVAARTLLEDGHEGQAYPLTGSEALSYHEVAAIMSRELGRPIAYRAPSLLRFAVQMRRRGLALPFVGVMAGIYTTARLGLAGRITPDTARLLGRPPISMSQFVHDYRACWL